MINKFDNLQQACAAVGIQSEIPKNARRGQFIAVPVIGKSPTNRSGRIKLFSDGRGGYVKNWVSGQEAVFFKRGAV